MNKLLKQALVATILMFAINQAMAAFSLNGTRFIYEEGKKNMSFEVSSSAQETFGGQVWVDNATQAKDLVYLIPSPPFFKLKPGQKQIVRLINVAPILPKDRESLFWLNVQEVPPMPKDSDSSVLAIAMNTQVKVFYRPKALIDGRKEAEKKLTVSRENGNTVLKNPTPYYFAIISVKINGSEVKLSKSTMDMLTQFAPNSEVSLGNVNLGGKVMVTAINDWGGEQDYAIK